MRNNRVEIATDEPTSGITDLIPFGRLLARARVIGLGEATHGTREFFRLKHRLLKLLATRHGPVTLAMEADYGNGLAIDRYVTGLEGQPTRPPLEKLYLIWRTREIADLLTWIRAHNAAAPPRSKIRFFGFDAQSADGALRELRRYLAKVEPTALVSLARLAPLLIAPGSNGQATNKRYRGLPPQKQAEVRAALKALLARLDARRQAYTARSSARLWITARQAVVVAQQAEALARIDPRKNFRARDLAMAQNVRWIAEVGAGKGTRVAVWAHNSHLIHPKNGPMMGAHLRRWFGPAYLAVGFLFHRGSFQTFDFSGPRFRWKVTTLGPSPKGFTATTLAKVGAPMFAVDLRATAPEAVSSWLRAKRPVRAIGHTYVAKYATRAARLGDELDALVFVARTSRARPMGPASPRK
jgi:erythromycin esterase